MLLKPIDERRRLVREAILADPAKSARQIAADLGVTYSMVVRHQVALIRAGKIPAELRIRGSDGRRYNPAIRMQVSSGLMYHISKVRALFKVVEGKPWRDADPRTRRILWLAAVKLAETIGEQIDTTTGHLVVEPPKGLGRKAVASYLNNSAQISIARPSDS